MKLLCQRSLNERVLIKSLYSLSYKSWLSASPPPFRNSIKPLPSSKIAGSAIGDHIEYLPPISLGKVIILLKPSSFALFGCEVIAIK